MKEHQEACPALWIERFTALCAETGIRPLEITCKEGPLAVSVRITPAEGTKVRTLAALANRAEERHSLPPIRAYDDRGVFVYEICKPNHAIVPLRELLQSFKGSSPTLLPFGVDINGEPILQDLQKLPHLLVSGSSGAGKTIFLHSLLAAMLPCADPKLVKIVLIDPKSVELFQLEQMPHLALPLIRDAREGVAALSALTMEMERRFDLLCRANVYNLADYNRANPESALPYLVVVVDELEGLLSADKKAATDQIARLAQKSRAVGILLVLSTQSTSLPPILRTSIPSILCFRTVNSAASRSILHEKGAETLGSYGDALFFPVGRMLPQRLHTAYVGTDELQALLQQARKTHGEACHESSLVELLQQCKQS